MTDTSTAKTTATKTGTAKAAKAKTASTGAAKSSADAKKPDDENKGSGTTAPQPETKTNEGDREKVDMTPNPDHNNVSQPGPTAFVTDPEQPPAPDEHALKFENTPQENVGPIPGNNVSAERIVQVWDGGERILATKMAHEAPKANRDKAVEARPELQRYLAGDPG